MTEIFGVRWTTVAYRTAAWTGIALATALSARDVRAQVAAGVLVAVAAITIQFNADVVPVRWRVVALTVGTVLGLVAVVISPSGLGEVPAYVGAFRLPLSTRIRAGQLLVLVDTIAVGAVVGYVSHSAAGALAGLGILLLAQRSEERRELVAERDRAQALLVEVQAGREAEAEAAALQERSRIARDLHDTLAHSLAGLSVQLQAVRAVSARDGATAQVLDLLDRAATLARDGLVEARAAVTALRNPIGLGLDGIAALVARHPGDAQLCVEGEPREVSADVGHALYRVVQEALTNAARYAPGARVQVAQLWAPGTLVVRVDDVGGRAAVAEQGTGLGLAGMSERIAAVDGTLTAGPRPDGGWRVEATVPA